MSVQPYDAKFVTKPPDVFVSYARGDYDKVRQITEQFGAIGVSFWLDQRDINGGQDFAAVIARNIRLSRVFVLMCSDASLRSRNVSREINLAWSYGRPYLPLLLERVSFPEQLKYFLEGIQWIEILDRPAPQWLPRVQSALTAAGVANGGTSPLSVSTSSPQAPEEVPVPPAPARTDLASLRLLASFTDCIWPVAAERAFRGLGGPQRDAQRTYKIGGLLGLVIYAKRVGHLLLIDEGQDGTIYCLCPSLFAPNTHIDKGMNYLPQANSPYPAFQLSGEPGREQLLAIITDELLELNWLPAGASSPARVLNPQDLELLLTRLRQLDPASWVALATYFDVVR